MRVALTVLAASLALAAPAGAANKTEVSELGPVRAEFSYTTHKRTPPTNLVQRIFDGGQLIVESVLPDDKFLRPGGLSHRASVKAVDLDGDGKAEVTFDLYTGGAHCCFNTEFYDPPSRAHFNQDWGNIGYRRQDFDGDGLPEFRTADDFFSGAYTAYAFSRQPLKVLRYDAEGLVDFTRDPSVTPALRKEAARFKRGYRRVRNLRSITSRQLVVSSLAGYAADQCSLGACGKGYALIRSAVRRGDVHGGPKRFLATVRNDLRRLGYDGPGVNCACAGPPPAPAPASGTP